MNATGRPRLLDLFCGAGGAAMGYHRAGFDVVGVDIKPQPHYPFEFHQADALTFPLDGCDAIHASPPCQGYSHGARTETAKATPRLIDPVRSRLVASALPYVIENVVGSRRSLNGGLFLCGFMFDLGIRRHRLFETSHLMWSPPHRCQRLEPKGDGKWRDRARSITGHVRYAGCLDDWRKWMDMPWADAYGLTQAIPPAYTEWIGRQLLAAVEAERVA